MKSRARQRQTEQLSQIGVLIPEAAKAQLDQRAAAEGLSLSHYCARILQASLTAEAAA